MELIPPSDFPSNQNRKAQNRAMVRNLEDKTRLEEYTMIVQSKEESSGKKKRDGKAFKTKQNKIATRRGRIKLRT